MDPDSSGLKLKQFHPKSRGLPSSDVGGVLLPSSSSLGRFLGRPMRWKVHLDRRPSRKLDYYFLRSSFDPTEPGTLQNVEEHTAYTPKNCRFDQDLQIELTVAEDGTASPRFLYKTGRDESETISTKGRPFYLDMTSGKPDDVPEAYIGLDFGTCNTSVSFVSRASIQVYEKRAHEKAWNDLNGLTSSLPYPVASPLAGYVGADSYARLLTAAREFSESALTIAAYLSYLEYCTRRGKAISYLFKGFAQGKRSAGPLWKFLKESLAATGKSLKICTPFHELVSPPFHDIIDRLVADIAKEKHGKLTGEMDTLRPVQILANVLQKVFGESKFGVFQQVQKQRFEKNFQGLFRLAAGRPPFLAVLRYSGDISFAPDEAYVVTSKSGLALQPLMFWNRCPNHPELDSGHCYMFDGNEANDSFLFKAAGYSCTCSASPQNELAPLAAQLSEFLKADPQISETPVGELSETPDMGSRHVI
jgi:hypothetical protein